MKLFHRWMSAGRLQTSRDVLGLLRKLVGPFIYIAEVLPHETGSDEHFVILSWRCGKAANPRS